MVLSANNSCSSINPPFPFEALVRGGPSPISCPRDHRFEDRGTVPTQSAPALTKTTVERRSQSISGGPRRYTLTCAKTPQQFLLCTCVPSKYNFQNWNGQIEKITPLQGKKTEQSRWCCHKVEAGCTKPPLKANTLFPTNTASWTTAMWQHWGSDWTVMVLCDQWPHAQFESCWNSYYTPIRAPNISELQFPYQEWTSTEAGNMQYRLIGG